MFVLWDDVAVARLAGQGADHPADAPNERAAATGSSTNAAPTGYLVERLTPGGRRLYALMAGMSSRLPDELRALLGELIADIGERVYLRRRERTRRKRAPTRFDISVISAPVFDHHHRQAMVVSLQIGRALTDDEIRERAKALVATADVVTEQLGGTAPLRRGAI